MVEEIRGTRFVITRAPSWRVSYFLVSATGEPLEDGAEFEAGWWYPVPSTEVFAEWIVDNRLDRGGDDVVVSWVEQYMDGVAPRIVFRVAIHTEDDGDDDDDDDDDM